MAHFDTACEFQTAFTIGTLIAFDHVAQIDKLRLGGIAAEVEAGVVLVVFIGANHPIGAFFGGEIGIHAAGETHGAERAAIGAELGTDLRGVGHGERGFHAGEFFGFDVVEFVVAAQEQQHDFACFFAFHHNGFERLFNRNI